MKKLNPEELGINPNSKSADEIKQLTKDYVKYLTGKDVEVVIIATGDGSGYIRGDQNGEDKKDVFLLDLRGLEEGLEVANLYGHEPNHVDDHRRGRDAGDEVTSTAAGDRLSEILGENGKSSGFDLSEWLSNNNNKQALIDGKNILDSECEGYEMEGHPYKAPTNPNYYYDPNQPMDKKPSNADIYYDYGKIMKPIDPQDITDLGNAIINILSPKNEEKNNSNNSGSSSNEKNKNNSSTKANEKTCNIECFTKNLNKDYYYNLLNAVMEEKKQFDDYFNPMSLIPKEKIFADLYSGLVNYKNEFYRRYDLVMEQQTEAFKRDQVPENWSEGDQEAFRSYPGNENKTVFNPKTLVNEGRWTDQDYKDYLNAPVRVVQQTLPVAEVFYNAYLSYSLSQGVESRTSQTSDANTKKIPQGFMENEFIKFSEAAVELVKKQNLPDGELMIQGQHV